MRVAICKAKYFGDLKNYTDAFIEGVHRHGDETISVSNGEFKNLDQLKEVLCKCDVVFQVQDVTPDKAFTRGPMSHKSDAHLLRKMTKDVAKKIGIRRIIVDTPLIHAPTRYFSIGFDGVKGSAQFHNENSPDDRRLKRGVSCKSWNKNGENILIISQCLNNYGLGHMAYEEARDYFIKLPSRIRKYTKRKIIFRLHPNFRHELYYDDFLNHLRSEKIIDMEISLGTSRLGPDFKRDYESADPNSGTPVPLLGKGYYPYTYTRDIDEDYNNCHCAITRTSAGIVDAILNGIPSISEDDLNIANPVSERLLENIENPYTPDREQWINDLCYAEWSEKECEEGEAWKHLRKHIDEA